MNAGFHGVFDLWIRTLTSHYRPFILVCIHIPSSWCCMPSASPEPLVILYVLVSYILRGTLPPRLYPLKTVSASLTDSEFSISPTPAFTGTSHRLSWRHAGSQFDMCGFVHFDNLLTFHILSPLNVSQKVLPQLCHPWDRKESLLLFLNNYHK